MSSLTHPVGPQGSGVYWRRRVALLLVVAVLAALTVFTLSRVGGDDASAAAPAADEPPAAGQADDTGQDDDTASDPATETDEAEPGEDAAAADPEAELRACSAEQLQVVATADAGSYAAGTTPQLGVAVRNTGEQACEVDLGDAVVGLLVVSGADRIWSSDDCEDGDAASVVTVDAQGEQAVTVEWPRSRSAEGCPGDLPEPRAGTYQLTATVGETTSAPLSFTLQ